MESLLHYVPLITLAMLLVQLVVFLAGLRWALGEMRQTVATLTRKVDLIEKQIIQQRDICSFRHPEEPLPPAIQTA